MHVSAMRVIVAVLAWFATTAMDAALVLAYPTLSHVRSMAVLIQALAGMALFALILRTGLSDLFVLMRTSEVLPQIATAVTCHALGAFVTSKLEVELLASPLGVVFFVGVFLLARATGHHATDGAVWTLLACAGCLAAAHMDALGHSLTTMLLQGGAVLLLALRNEQCAEALKHTSVASVALQWFTCLAALAAPAAVLGGGIAATLRMSMLAPVTMHAMLGVAVTACGLVMLKRVRMLTHGLTMMAGSSVAWSLVSTQLGHVLSLLQVSGLWGGALATLQYADDSAQKSTASPHAADVPAPRVVKAGMVLGVLLLVAVTMPRTAHDLHQLHLAAAHPPAGADATAATADASEHHVLSSHPPQTGLPINDLCVAVETSDPTSSMLERTVRSVLSCGHRDRLKLFASGSDSLAQQSWNHEFHEVRTFRAEAGVEELLRSSLVKDPPVAVVQDATRRAIARDAMISLFTLSKCIANARRGEMVLLLREGMAATRSFVHHVHELYDANEDKSWNVLALDGDTTDGEWPSVRNSGAILFHPQRFEGLLNMLKRGVYDGPLRASLEALRNTSLDDVDLGEPLFVSMADRNSAAGVCWVQGE